MKRPLLVGLAVSAGAALASGVAATVLGSRPDGVGADGPLAPCGAALNCYRSRRALAATPEIALAAAEAALREIDHPLTGRVLSTERTPEGLRAVFQVGPFRDDVTVAAEPRGESRQAGEVTGATLYVRSASRAPGSDLGVNRRRAERLFAAVAARLDADAAPTDAL